MKYKIEKNTVQETLIIPLFARKVCSGLYPDLYRDETAVCLIDDIDYDFSEAEKNSRHASRRRFACRGTSAAPVVAYAILIIIGIVGVRGAE